MRRLGITLATIRGWLLLLVLIAVVVFALGSLLIYFLDRPKNINAVKPPSTAYQVLTDTRMYFTDHLVKNSDRSYTLQGYWDSQRGEWKYSKDELPLGKAFGNVKVISLTGPTTAASATPSKPSIPQLPVPLPAAPGPKVTPSLTPSATATITPTPSPKPSVTSTPTPKPTPSVTTVTPTKTPTPTPTKRYPWQK